MINRLKIKKRMVQTSILVTVMFTHTGCFFGYFNGPKVSVEKPVQENFVQKNSVQEVVDEKTFSQTSSAPVKVVFSAPTPKGECTDGTTSNCNKPPVKEEELKPKIETPSGGEVHKLKSIQGKSITVVERSNGFIFPEYKNKIIILEMFGKKCPHCIKEMPTLNKLRRKYRGKLEVIAIQVENRMGKSEANRLIKRHKIHYPIIPGETATNLQYNIQNTYGWTGILPFTMVVKNGVTELSYKGRVSYREINRDIRTILK